MEDEKEKQPIQEAEEQPEAQPEQEEQPVEDKFHVQVINMLQELCDLVKALNVDDAKEEAQEVEDDAAQFDELLDE